MKLVNSHKLRIMTALLAGIVMMSSLPATSYASPKGKKTAAAPAKKKSQTNGKRRSATQSKDKTPSSSAEAKRMRDAAEKDIRQTKEQLRLNEQEMKQGLADLNRLSAEIAEGNRQVAGLQGKVNSLQSEISSLTDEISKNEAQLAKMREEYLKAVKKMRLTSKNQSMLAFVFSSENFNQALRRIRYMRQFSEWKDKKSADINAKVEQLGQEREKLSQVKDMQASTLAKLNATQKTLAAKHGRQQELVAGLRHNGDMLQSHLASKQREANRLNESISALIAQEQAKAEAERRARERAAAEEKRRAEEKAAAEAARLKQQQAEAHRNAEEKTAKQREEERKKKEKEEKKAAKKRAEEEKKRKKNSEKGSRRKTGRRSNTATYVTNNESPAKAAAAKPTASAANFESLRGSLPRPVEGSWRVTNPFGRHSMPELPEIVYDNPGIDAEVAKGASVKAVSSGKVSGVYKVAGYGTVVILNHGDYYTVYGNLDSVNVSVGSQVGTGQIVGKAASDPDDPRNGSVHFEVWRGREKLNPESWLR